MARCFKLCVNATTASAGDLLFEPKDTTTVEIVDFHVYPEFAGKGIGATIINKLQDLLREQGFVSVTGICKSYDRPSSEKKKLAHWYMNLGFILLREDIETEPGYLGTLTKNL